MDLSIELVIHLCGKFVDAIHVDRSGGMVLVYW
jgi:hypothetical protein